MNLDIEKMKKQLQSGGQYIPKYKDVNELHQWMKGQRLSRRSFRKEDQQ